MPSSIRANMLNIRTNMLNSQALIGNRVTITRAIVSACLYNCYE
jgi:hypothetical protein